MAVRARGNVGPHGQPSVPLPRPKKPPPPTPPTKSPTTHPPPAVPTLKKSASVDAIQPQSLVAHAPSKAQANTKPKSLPPKAHPRSKSVTFSKPPLPPKPEIKQLPTSFDTSSSVKGLEEETTLSTLRSLSSHVAGLSQPSKPQCVPTLSKAITLQQLLDDYSEQFPLHIKVLQGYEGETSQLCLSNSDVYNVHFAKHRKVVSIQDNQGNTYSVPLNSSAQFGIVYTPNETSTTDRIDCDHPKKPPRFQKVSNIVALGNRLPRVVCATKSCKGSEEKSSVVENEVLIIMGIHKPEFHGKKGLQVFSLSTKGHKCLPLECSGHFTTDPSLVRMHLPEIVGYISNPFPCKAVVFLGSDFEAGSQHISASVLSGRVTMIESKVETSLIVSSVIDPMVEGAMVSSTENPHLDIPIDDCLSGVEVAVMETEESDAKEQLYENTRHLLETLDLSKVKTYKDTGSAQTYSVQSALYSTFQKGREKYGIEVDIPAAAFRYTNPPTLPKKPAGLTTAREDKVQYQPLLATTEDRVYEDIRLNSSVPGSSASPVGDEWDVASAQSGPEYDTLDAIDKERENVYSDLSCGAYDRVRYEAARPEVKIPSNGCFSSENVPLPGLPRKNNSPSSPVAYYRVMRPASTDLDDGNTGSRALNGVGMHRRNVTPGKDDELTALRSVVEQLSRRVESLENQVQELHLHVGPVDGKKVNTDVGSGLSTEAVNVSRLKTLGCQEVQALLDTMGLSQYKHTFATEQVSGDILSHLTDSDLQNYLGITNNIHRKRLARIISGRKPV